MPSKGALPRPQHTAARRSWAPKAAPAHVATPQLVTEEAARPAEADALRFGFPKGSLQNSTHELFRKAGAPRCHSPCCAACRAPALCRAGTLLRLPQVRAASGAPCAWAEAWVWYCPTCGQPARPRGDSGRLRRPRRLQGGHQRARLLPARGRRGAAVRAVPVAGDQVAPAAPRRVCGRAVVLDAHVPAQRAAARLGWRP